MGIHKQLVAAGNRGADGWEEEVIGTKMTVEDDAVMNDEQAAW